MRLHKTNKAKAELQPGVRTLGQRQRTLLLMADGRKTIDDFSKLFVDFADKLSQHFGPILSHLVKDKFAYSIVDKSKSLAFS